MLFIRNLCAIYLQVKIKVVTLHRVFHSIRFKVNKVGVQRYSFFYALTQATGMRGGTVSVHGDIFCGLLQDSVAKITGRFAPM